MEMEQVLQKEKIVIAHRGDSAHCTENTMTAFRQAHEKGAHVLETDVHLTRDKKVIIWHDDSFSGIEGGSQTEFSQLLYADIVSESESLIGERVPLLSDLLEDIPESCINIDLKDTIPELSDYYIEVVKAQKAFSRIITGSFHHSMLTRFRKQAPEARTSASPREVKLLLVSYLTGIIRIIPSLSNTILQVPEVHGSTRVVSEGFAKTIRRKGGKIHVWTVNDYRDMKRLYSWGVQGIVTDDPGLALQFV